MTTNRERPQATPPLVAVILDAARPYDRLIISGVSQYVREHAVWRLYVEEDPLQKLPDLKHWHGHGIIANFDDRHVAKAIRGLDIPIVGVGGGYGWYEPASGIPYIYTDNATIGRLGAEHLLTCGFEHLAFYGYPRTATSGWSEERAAAFAAACAAFGRPCQVFTGRHGTARRWEELQRDLATWIAGLPRPVGLMACNDVRARHVLEACRTLALRVPHDVAVLGVDNDEMICELTDPPLSSVDQSARRIGYESAAMLDRLILAGGSSRTARRAAAPERIVVPPIGVIARASTDTMATTEEDVVRTLQRLRENPWRKPDIAALASEACVSRSTLEHRFKAVVGRSIHEEFVRLRLAGVRRLIADTDLPLKSIAARTGFPSVQYMTTFLHRHTGLTPARLRTVERRRVP
ncbi:MAG: DNA-binding transcriptional regulator [Pirellulales bacterium]